MLLLLLSCSVVSDSLQPYAPYTARLLRPCDSAGKNTGIDCHSLLQGIFPTQGLSPGPPTFQAESLPPGKWNSHFRKKHIKGMLNFTKLIKSKSKQWVTNLYLIDGHKFKFDDSLGEGVGKQVSHLLAFYRRISQ